MVGLGLIHTKCEEGNKKRNKILIKQKHKDGGSNCNYKEHSAPALFCLCHPPAFNSLRHSESRSLSQSLIQAVLSCIVGVFALHPSPTHLRREPKNGRRVQSRDFN
ncbi:hypothetical protein L6452_01867 [Arctium lappa]|uniref:Uncharacterized protein n=1 Tax=Arctium lappa TaxID=4217 RepID=A0ACB9FIT9_ARCLA|nr:hypothetical protein L6452_01867 [Arctium lappa]